MSRLVRAARRACLAAAALCFAFAALLAVPRAGSAAVSTAADSAGGRWALQFGITQNFSLSTFSGGIISVKRQCSPTRAWRLGLTGTLDGSDNTETAHLRPDSTRSQGTTIRSQSLGVELQYLLGSAASHHWRSYWGVGPYANVNHQRQKQAYTSGGHISTNTNWKVGLLNTLGVEWNPATSVGLHAEYGLGVEYAHGSIREEYPGGSTPYSVDAVTKGWHAQGRNVRFGLTVYL